MALLRCTTVRVRDGVALVVLEGELDAYSSSSFHEHLDTLVGAGVSVVEADMHLVGFIDSGGLAALLSATRRLRDVGGDLILRSPTPGTRRVIEITGLNRAFTITQADDAVPAHQARRR